MTSVQDLSCIFCKESFEDKETLQVHFRKHGDPKFNQTIKPKNRIQNESPTTSDASKDENDMVSCDVCSEVFPTISKAITHKHKVHPDHDAKYFCPWCGKLFTLKHLYNKHLETSHDDSMSSEVTRHFHCDYCDVDFFAPSAMVYHNKFFHRQDKDIPSVGYSKKVKLICQELVQVYYCPFCGEEYDNKVNLRKHTTDEHIDENQNPVDILRCPLCEAIFYHLDAYELHLTFHSSEDLYSEENEMIKQITEFSLDIVPPLIEKLEAPVFDGENEELNAISIDQFLQLSMSKEPEEELVELQTKKMKSKKHKKHKKSKKSITLDEFLNMNTDVFGEGLNFQGIEEVPTRVVTKQLKPKKEYGLKSSQKHTVLPTDIDKLKKQGIIIKRKGEKKPISSTLCDESSSSKSIRVSPINPNVISTSSEVLSKLMSQSNSQIKVVKRAAINNHSPELNANEKTLSQELVKELQGNNTVVNETNIENNVCDNIRTDKSVQDSTLNSHDPPTEVIKRSNNPSPVHTGIISSSNETNNDNNLNLNLDEVENKNVNVSEVSSSSDINNKNPIERRQTLNDFEEDLTKILPIVMSENREIESEESETNINNETTGQEKTQGMNNKLNFVKHLGHIMTVKSVNNSQSSITEDNIADKIEDSDHEMINNEEIMNNTEEKLKDNIGFNSKLDIQKQSSSKTMGVLKNISKHVTIKPLTSEVSSPKSVRNLCQEDDGAQKLNDYKNSTKNIVGKKVVNMKSQNHTDVAVKVSQVDRSSQKLSHDFKKPQDSETSSISDGESVKFGISNADILKRLKNVTAKPISSPTHMKQHMVQSSVHSLNTKKENRIEKVMTQEKINEEIEIFNIDDSDSDSQEKDNHNSEIETAKFSIKSDNINNMIGTKSTSHEALRNISKNITVKSMNETSRNKGIFKGGENFPEQSTSFSDEDGNINYNEKRINKFSNQQNKNLESKLKSLSKHITVKSRNSSPNLLLRQNQDKNLHTHDRVFGYDTESDSDSTIGKVKVTELSENTFSENEFQSDEDDTKDKNKFVHSPTSTDSDVDDNYDDEEDNKLLSDVENDNDQDIRKVHLSQSMESEQCPINNFKKFNKEITIKSMNEKNNSSVSNKEKNTFKDSDTLNHKELSVRLLRPNIPQHNKSEIQTTCEKAGNISNQVNKEVSVKTFQSQTVIEEITTTVTKTIRTVNQTVNQEVKNTSQTANVSTVIPQKIAKYNQQNKNTIMTVRQSSPSVGTRVKNVPNTCSNSKPKSQLMPVLSGTHWKKVCTTATPIKNVKPNKASLQKPIPGRALKISPQAMNQSMKRASAESAGHYPCFKKPKELPSEVPTLRDDQDGETTMHLSATQSRSDFSSTVKNVKGKSLVTSTQVKSVMSKNSHLSKLGNMSVMKTVKTSSKQATQYEDKVETNENKKALEALQKLQIQGLLIKRPRMDDNDENNYTNSGSESDEEAC